MDDRVYKVQEIGSADELLSVLTLLKENNEDELGLSIGPIIFDSFHFTNINDFKWSSVNDPIHFENCRFSDLTTKFGYPCETFSNCLFLNCQLTDLNHSKQLFSDCSFLNCSISDAFRVSNQKNCSFTHSTIENSNLKKGSGKTKFDQCSIRDCSVSIEDKFFSDGTHFFDCDIILSSSIALFIHQHNVIQCRFSTSSQVTQHDNFPENLQKANLDQCKFQGPTAHSNSNNSLYLKGGMFSGANLKNASFNNLNLQNANFDECQLDGATFTECNLSGADFQDANLANAIFREDEKTPNLEVIPSQPISPNTGYSTEMFSGADLSNVTLPETIRHFPVLTEIATLSNHCRNNFLATMLLTIVSFIGVLSIDATDLIQNSRNFSLPVININLPARTFVIVAPLGLVIAYLYLHIYLLRLWQQLTGLPAIFPDGKEIYKRTPSWMLSSLLIPYLQQLKPSPEKPDRRPRAWRVQSSVSQVFAYWIPVAIPVYAFIQTMPLRDAALSAPLLILSVASLVMAIWFAIESARTLSKGKIGLKNLLRHPFTQKLIVAPAIFCLFALAAAAWIYIQSSPTQLFIARNSLLLENARLTHVPDRFYGVATLPSEITGPNLRGMDLRHATILSTQMVRAIFEDSKLHGALIKDTDFSESNLAFTDFRDACVLNSSWNGSDFDSANARGSIFMEQDRPGHTAATPRQIPTRFLNSDLSETVWMNIDAGEASLTEASFKNAVLINSDFSQAVQDTGFTSPDFSTACTIGSTKLPHWVDASIVKPCTCDKVQNVIERIKSRCPIRDPARLRSFRSHTCLAKKQP